MQTMYFRTLFVLLLLNILSISIAPGDGQQIPDHLVHCYRGNATFAWLPNTMQLFIELVRKIEDANPTSIDMRLLSVNLMHRLRVDGIQHAASIGETDFVIPFRANGVQVPKYQMLLQLVSDTPYTMAFDRWLSSSELCHLHRMLSASVEPFERGDETRSCPLNMSSVDRVASPWFHWNKVQDPFSAATIISTERVSRCPLELGVIRSNGFGSITPGTVITSIAAGVQFQRVGIAEFFKPKEFEEQLESMSRRDTTTLTAMNTIVGSLDTINNAYASGLAGDLAEVCVYQGPYLGTQVLVGMPGTWNNTIFPRTRFLFDAHEVRWEITDAELLAGIDGLFLSQQISGWLRRLRRLRLSQVLDMYYSGRGVPTSAIDAIPLDTSVHIQPRRRVRRHSSIRSSVKGLVMDRFSNRDDLSSACHRQNILSLIDREVLREETYNMAQVLQFRRSSLAVSDATLRTNCDAAVERFFVVAKELLNRLPTCTDVNVHEAVPVVDLTLVLDGSRSEYENLELVSFISEAIDVSNTGSKISIINGQSGQYMVRQTRSVSSTFEQLRNSTGSFPRSFSISRSFQALRLALSNQTLHERRNFEIAGTSHVVVIVSQKERINQLDFESASRMIHGSLLEFPDLYFVFITNSPDQFEDLIADAQSRFDMRRRQEHFKIIRTVSGDVSTTSLGAELVPHLNTIPMRVMSPFCRNGSQDYEFDRNVRFVFYEEYLSRYVEYRYRIDTTFLLQTEDVRVSFQVNYGTASICMSRDSSHTALECHTIDESKSAVFTIQTPCPIASECTGIFFTITVDESQMRCFENRCRYPDQVLLIMNHRGLRCVPDDRSNAKRIYQNNFLCLIYFISVIILFYRQI